MRYIYTETVCWAAAFWYLSKHEQKSWFPPSVEELVRQPQTLTRRKVSTGRKHREMHFWQALVPPPHPTHHHLWRGEIIRQDDAHKRGQRQLVPFKLTNKQSNIIWWNVLNLMTLTTDWIQRGLNFQKRWDGEKLDRNSFSHVVLPTEICLIYITCTVDAVSQCNNINYAVLSM